MTGQGSEPAGLPSRRCRLTRARVEPVTESQFQFTDTYDSGFVAEILAVPDWSGELVELIAWRRERPGRWWLHAGDVVLIGEDLAELAGLRKEPVCLVGTPAEWWARVSAGGDGLLCVIDWSADPRLVLTGLHLRCSAPMAKRLREWWDAHAGPNFTVEIEGEAHAA